MTISLSTFKSQCEEAILKVEREGLSLDITRNGQVVARIVPAEGNKASSEKPWMRLRGTGSYLATAEEPAFTELDMDSTQ